MPRAVLIAVLVLLLFISATPALDKAPSAGEWPQWRGPNRDGLSPDTGLLKSWPKEGPKLLWEAKGAGRGYASVAITAGKIYTLGDGLSTADDKDEYVSCFEQMTGKQLWKTKIGPAWTSGQPDWQSSRSTPTVDGDLLYALSPQGSLVCLQSTDGKEVWRKSMQKDFSGRKGDGWGYSESPLIDGEKLICTPGGDKMTMVALNKKTGERMWNAAISGDRGAGHASPMLAQVDGKRLYVQTTASFAFGASADDGKVHWTYPIRSTAVIPTPIIRGDLAFVDAGYGTGGALLKMVPDGSGIKTEEIYGYKRELNNKHGGIVLVGDYLYGDADSSGTPWCAEFKTGTVKWKKRGSGRGSAAVGYADGHLYVRYADGTLALAKADPGDYKETGSFKIPHSGERPSWSHPVIIGGRLYLREQDWILCYDVKGQ
jgi:outer membrane protein assembly factor BamB